MKATIQSCREHISSQKSLINIDVTIVTNFKSPTSWYHSNHWRLSLAAYVCVTTMMLETPDTTMMPWHRWKVVDRNRHVQLSLSARRRRISSQPARWHLLDIIRNFLCTYIGKYGSKNFIVTKYIFQIFRFYFPNYITMRELRLTFERNAIMVQKNERQINLKFSFRSDSFFQGRSNDFRVTTLW